MAIWYKIIQHSLNGSHRASLKDMKARNQSEEDLGLGVGLCNWLDGGFQCLNSTEKQSVVRLI